MADACVEVIRHGGWAEVVLTRPERKNAIVGPMGTALAAALTELGADDDVHVLLLRGSGGAFCSGLDLKEFNAEPAPSWLPEFPRIWRSAHRALFDLDKPIVGALERYAINGGAALAIACDVLIAGHEAFLHVGEVQIGMAAPYNLAWLSLRHSESVNAQVALIGERLPGPDLVRVGLAQRCVPDQDVLEEAQSLCTKLAGYPPDALARIKTGLRARLNEGADAWFDRFTGAVRSPSRPPRMPSR